MRNGLGFLPEQACLLDGLERAIAKDVYAVSIKSW